MEVRSPFVYWSQDYAHIFLRVDVHDAKDVKADTSNNGKSVDFSAVDGKGIRYQFQLELFDKVKDRVNVVTNDVKVELALMKANFPSSDVAWKSLIDRSVQRSPPPWLKFDFSRWQPDESSDEDGGGADDMMSEKDYYKKLWNELAKKDGNNNLNFMTKEELRKKLDMMHSTYLCAYNMCMFVAHFYVLSTLLFGFFVDRHSGYLKSFWDEKYSSFIACTLLQYMDVLHCVAGLTTSNWQTTALQVSGRLAVLLVINGNPGVHSWLPVFVLMLAYFMGEQFRYPFYALSSLGISIAPITWLRYSHFLLFYPVGFLMEGLIFVRSINYYYSTGKYSIALPNSLNVSFNFGIILAVICVSAFPCVAISLFRHMLSQRSKKLGCNKLENSKKIS